MRTFLCLLLLAAFAGSAMADADVSGKWSGSFNMMGPNGETKETTALLMLKQTGSTITGSLGPSEDEQHTITKGKIEGGKISLEAADGNMSIKFELALTGDRITGEATADGEGRTMKAKLDVTRKK